MCHVLVALLEDISIAFFADISIAFFPAKAMAMKSKAAQSKAMKSKAMKSKATQSKAMQSKAMKSKAMQSKANLKRGDVQCSGSISLDTFGDDARRCPRTRSVMCVECGQCDSAEGSNCCIDCLRVGGDSRKGDPPKGRGDARRQVRALVQSMCRGGGVRNGHPRPSAAR